MLIEVQHLAVKYQLPFQRSIDALLDVSLEVDTGQIVGILGRNGAGKTTLLRTLVGLIRPFSGSLKVFQLDPSKERVKIVHQCGVLLDGQRLLPPRWTPSDLLTFQGTKFGLSNKTIESRSKILLDRFNLYKNRSRTIMSLSRGMKQKLALCVSLINNPKLLILDEPTLGLDVEATQELLGEIRTIASEENRSVLITSHQLALIEKIAHRVLVIHDGKDIFFDSPSTLIKTVGRGTIKLTFSTITSDFLMSLPETIQVQNDTIIAPSDSNSMHQIFSSAHQYGAELILVEQGLDFENSFLELTKG